MNLIAEFIQFLQQRRFSDKTLEAYQADLQECNQFMKINFNFCPFESLETFANIKTSHLRKWIVQLNLEPASVRRKMSAFRSLTRFLQRKKGIQNTPATQIKMPKLKRKLPTTPTEAMMNNVFEQPTVSNEKSLFDITRDKAILEVLYGCGLRRSEVIKLLLSQIFLQENQIKVVGKGKKERLIPFGEYVKTAFENYIKERDALGFTSIAFFFLTEKGKPIYEMLVHRVVRQALSTNTDLPKNSPHVLRHAYATHLVDNGAPINSVKDLLGHSSLATTQIYVHNSFAKLKDTYKKSHPRAKE